MKLARRTATLSIAFALAACHHDEAAVEAPQPIVAMAVHPSDALAELSLPGEIDARYSTPLSFRVAGKLVERRVRLGDTVNAGQVLARLDPADLQRDVSSAQAQYEAAKHRLVYAKQQLDRDKTQAAENLITAAQFEQTQDAYASAAAQREQAGQQLALARNQLQYATLTADHAGIVTAEDADTGQNVSIGQAVYHLAWTGAFDVVCDAPEVELAALTVGRSATVTLAAAPGKQLTARVREISPAADPQSRTYRVKLTLDHPSPDVRLGMTANVAFDSVVGAAKSFTLPATALFHDGNDPAVWVVHASAVAPTAGTLELRRVQVARYGERTISVSGGLHDNDQVVLQGVHAVSTGERVRVVAPLHPEDLAS